MRPQCSILLVEDDEVDAMTVERAMRDIHVTNHLDVVQDGEAALMYLRDPMRASPCLILLDLNLPRMSGLELLQVVKSDDDLRSIPVVVLTSSSEERDRMASFCLGVAGYMLKPVDYQQFVEVMRAIDLYWTLSELPPA